MKPAHTSQHLDVIVVGAGLSGICAGYHLQQRCADRSYAILEARDSIGGTWDLFRYPGIRSDSDMYTLGFSFRPWREGKAIADGASILKYVRDTASEFGIDRHIRYGHRVVSAAWSSEAQCWTVEAEVGPQRSRTTLTCSFLYLCSGYYRYDRGHTPDFPGMADFSGEVVHPQFWPEDLDYAGKRVIVIGSGATAVTLVPSMAESAAKVTMLQRSPSYVLSLPARDAFAERARRLLPEKTAYELARWKNILMSLAFYQFCRRAPGAAKKLLRKGIAAQLPKEVPLEPHFRPSYEPWDQRLCFVPNGDLFRSMRRGKAEIVTDSIERVTAEGIRLKSGRELEADIIVTATGLELVALGNIAFSVDGEAVSLPERYSYKGMMLSDVPNLALALGYTNASWTLKAELTTMYVCRLLNHMRAHAYTQCTPRVPAEGIGEEPIIDLASNYVLRAIDQFPKQGARAPWKLYQNYVLDLLALKYGRVEDRNVEFSRSERTEPAETA